MKHSITGAVQANRLRLTLSAISIVLLSGCVGPSPHDPAPSARVQTLDASLSRLKAEFNRDTSKPRLLALFSPTCGGCVYGARALQQEARAASWAAEGAEVLVVWLPMLESDNEREARKSARRFDFLGAQHFYDTTKQTSARLMAEQFPNALSEALEGLPRDHRVREGLEARKNSPPKETPLWDALLVFPPGVRWDDRSPAPLWWTRQIGFSGEEKPGEPTAEFWKNSTRRPPVQSDWFLEAREALRIAQQSLSKNK